MGWTGIVANHYKNNKIDRMKEFLDIFHNSKNFYNDNVYVVKKARQVGSTIYAANLSGKIVKMKMLVIHMALFALLV